MGRLDKDSLQKLAPIISAAGIAMTVYGFTKQIPWVWETGITIVVIAVTVFLFATFFMKKDEGKKEFTIMGDNFTNNGNNFGHMGNVTNNFVTPPRTLVGPDTALMLQNLDKSKKVELRSSMSDHESQAFAIQIEDFLKSEGFNVVHAICVPSTPFPVGVRIDNINNIIQVGPKQ